MNKKIISFLLLSVCFFVFASSLFACGDSLKTTNDENLIGSNSNLEFEITNDNGISYSVVGYKEFFNDERDNEIVIPSLGVKSSSSLKYNLSVFDSLLICPVLWLCCFEFRSMCCR